jgi:ankyrin repeat protein
MSALHYAARQGAKEAVRRLPARSRLNQADPDGVTALIYATIDGHYDTAALLLERAPIQIAPTRWAGPCCISPSTTTGSKRRRPAPL